ncbi:tail completion protein gp17 [Sphingomonas sp. Leaf10]|uniref:tail completion protein gp17 n=1 Tax=Sphingomonas sp. Leaf10 TaxID=1735676 RepID=UPI0006FDD04E|nr:DUF3168 domain-containing protein [Sphingomonas sp. Leaf10]KQM37619.1 hypothetical protein ASE59_14135 [Sphingomonas sp. Leaf10]
MSFEAALAKRLLSAAPVSAAVGTRVDWMRRVQGATLPAITLHTISDRRGQHMKGFQPTVARIQIDVWANDFAASLLLRDAVITAVVPAAAIDGVRFQRGKDVSVRAEREETGDGTDLYRQIIDIQFTYTNSLQEQNNG